MPSIDNHEVRYERSPITPGNPDRPRGRQASRDGRKRCLLGRETGRNPDNQDWQAAPGPCRGTGAEAGGGGAMSTDLIPSSSLSELANQINNEHRQLKECVL